MLDRARTRFTSRRLAPAELRLSGVNEVSFKIPRTFERSDNIPFDHARNKKSRALQAIRRQRAHLSIMSGDSNGIYFFGHRKIDLFDGRRRAKPGNVQFENRALKSGRAFVFFQRNVV